MHVGVHVPIYESSGAMLGHRSLFPEFLRVRNRDGDVTVYRERRLCYSNGGVEMLQARKKKHNSLVT